MSIKEKEQEVVFTKRSPYMMVDVENIENSKSEKVQAPKVVSMCRCGGSNNKPFCDGTHSKIGFVGEKEEDRVKHKKHVYKGEKITVFFDPGICAHSGICLKNLPEVFDTNNKSWINPNGSEIDNIIEAVQKCPSGALSYSSILKENVEYEMEKKIKISKNGPLQVSGGILIRDDGNSSSELESEKKYCLCRCGKSKNKPFCDGTHHTNKFQAD